MSAREDVIVRTCCNNDLSTTQAARLLGMSVGYCRAVRQGKYLVGVLPHIRRPGDLAARTCRDCRFYTGREERPCDLGLPGAEGVSAARSCGTYLP